MKDMNGGTKAGVRFFIVHLCVEMVCFATLRHYYPWEMAALIAFAYDLFAFVPQGIMGEAIDKYRKLPLAVIGIGMMAVGVFMSVDSVYGIHLAGIIIMALGNAILHEQGALETVAGGNGKIFPAALFVSGGSFGLVIGQTMGIKGVSLCWLAIPFVVMLILILTSDGIRESTTYPEFDCVRFLNKKKGDALFPIGVVIFIAFLVTSVRSYIGYAIPISWKKEIWQDFLLFFTMGIGKASGGFLADRFGARKVGVLSTLLAIPFLIFGDNMMVVSVIGVCLFSMTMCITFEMIMSVLPKNPGMAFGITTIGLFLGTVPVFFVRFTTEVNSIIVVILSLICSCMLYISCSNNVLKGSKK